MNHLVPKKLTFMRDLHTRLPLLFWCLLVVVTYAMLIELPPKHGGWPHWDKVQHLLVFVVLTGLAFVSYPKLKWPSVALLMIYGAIIEWLQAMLTVTRMASLGDWLADATGVVLTLLLCRWLLTIIAKKADV